MDLDIDLVLKPAWDGVWDESEEIARLRAYEAKLEHEYQARGEIEKQDLWYWHMLVGWNRETSLGAGIMLFLHDLEGWL